MTATQEDYASAAPVKTQRGLLCGILENKAIGNCSNYGISHRAKHCILIGDGVPEIHSPDPSCPAVMLGSIMGHTYAVPVDQPPGMVGPMFGGCFIHTSDSRFPSHYPIPLHDRFESKELADSMHN